MKKQPVPFVNDQPISVWQRRYLYFTAAVTGGAIMIVEILGAKMLAPYVGTSHFVWTAQIAVTLVALATGYYVGGRMVDRSPRPGQLYLSIVVAAIYLALAVLAIEPIAYWCLHFRLAMGTLLASAFLFFLPLSLLAMVGPFFIRMLTSSVSTIGGNVGRLTSISTLGSFVGTVLIGYVLIPFLPNTFTMLLTAALLLAVSGGYVFLWSKKNAPAIVIGILIALAIGYFAVQNEHRPRFARMEELTRRNSDFGQLQVIQEKDGVRRYYLNDYLTQNTYDSKAKKSISMFTYMLHDLARAYTPHVDEVLCIGLGVGIVPMEFAREGTKVDVVEINPAVVAVGKEFFNLEPEKLNLSIGDGRYFVNRCTKQYDAVILDAFLGDSCPSHLMTREAFAAISRILKPNGTLVINSFGDFEAGHDFFTASLFKTLSSVFPSVRIHKGDGGNTLFVAAPRQDLQMAHAPTFDHVHSSCVNQVREAFDGLRETNPAHGQILTDDYNPVEFFDAENRESVRQELVSAMQRL